MTGEPYQDANTKIWSLDQFPARVPVKVVLRVEPLHAVPILMMEDRLSIFQKTQSPNAWTGAVRASPAQWSKADGEAVVAALEEAQRNPAPRQFDPKKLAKVPPLYRTKQAGAVTIPQDDEETDSEEVEETSARTTTPGKPREA